MKCRDENTQLGGTKITYTIKDEEFWEDVENILANTKPIFLVIKFCDGEGPKKGEIYKRIDNMLHEIKMLCEKINTQVITLKLKVLMWLGGNMTIPLHCLGFDLSTKF